MLTVLRDLNRYNVEFAVSAALVGLIVLYAGLSFFSPYNPTDIYVVIPDQPPGAEYRFGTNSRGQDLIWNLSFASRNTLAFGLMVALLSRVISIAVGLAAGYLGGWVDRALMFVNDIFVAIPSFPILILLYYAPRAELGTFTLALAMACLGLPFNARLIRTVTLGLRHREFTRQAVFAGMSPVRIMLGEHLPYVMPLVFSTAMANMIWSIGLEVTLAVLGFTNITIPTVGTTPYWANNHSAMVVGVWWWILIPVVLIVMMFLGLFLLAVSTNEYIDPRSRLRRMGAWSDGTQRPYGRGAQGLLRHGLLRREPRGSRRGRHHHDGAGQRGVRHRRGELVGHDQLHQGAGRRHASAAASRGRLGHLRLRRYARGRDPSDPGRG